MKVSWDDYSQYTGKSKNVPNHQPNNDWESDHRPWDGMLHELFMLTKKFKTMDNVQYSSGPWPVISTYSTISGMYNPIYNQL